MEDQTYAHDLVAAVYENLENQQDWTSLKRHAFAPESKNPLPRPLISDDQIEMIKNNTMNAATQTPEVEWVLSTSLNETISLGFLSSIFDAMDRPAELPAGRSKRLLLAVKHDDSTVVYYFVHDGIVKPRQN
ncbi:hypothetical protein LQW54_010255 [Pestalotiopsis sp. IQ-011]